jgi:cation:H+ antiporter
LALASLFVTQLALAFFYQATPEREIAVLTALAWVNLALAVALLARHIRRVPELARTALGAGRRPNNAFKFIIRLQRTSYGCGTRSRYG